MIHRLRLRSRFWCKFDARFKCEVSGLKMTSAISRRNVCVRHFMQYGMHMYAYWYCLFTSIVQMYCNCVFSKSLLYTLTSCLHTPFIHLISYMSEYMHYCMYMFMVCFPPDLESFCFCLSLDVSSMGKWRPTMDETWSLFNIAMVEVVYKAMMLKDDASKKL